MPSAAAAAVATCIAMFNLNSFDTYNSAVASSDGTEQGTEILFLAPRAARDFTNIGKTIVFTNTSSASGTELWKTDGTSDGSQVLKDIYKGKNSSHPAGQILNDRFAMSRKTGVFAAESAETGREIWTTDGTAGGTLLLRDFAEGSKSGVPNKTYDGTVYLASNGRTTYFLALDPTGKLVLWSTDGTRAGTQRAAPGNLDGRRFGTAGFVGETFLFSYDGGQLWRTRGTIESAEMIKDFGASAIYMGYVSTQSYGVLQAHTAGTGNEPWVTDGTSAGTKLLKDIMPSTASSYPAEFFDAGSYTLFIAGSPGAGDEIWVTRGTPSSTQMLKNLNPGNKSTYIFSFARLGNKVVFSAYVSGGGQSRDRLYITDGTPEGTELLSSFAEPTGEFAAIGDTLLFADRGTGTSDELWATKGGYNDQTRVASFEAERPNSTIAVMSAVNAYRDAPHATPCPE